MVSAWLNEDVSTVLHSIKGAAHAAVPMKWPRVAFAYFIVSATRATDYTVWPAVHLKIKLARIFVRELLLKLRHRHLMYAKVCRLLFGPHGSFSYTSNSQRRRFASPRPPVRRDRVPYAVGYLPTRASRLEAFAENITALLVPWGELIDWFESRPQTVPAVTPALPTVKMKTACIAASR